MAHANSTCLEFTTSGVVCYGVFFNYANQTEYHPGVDCKSAANFNPDIAGIGVVASFGISAVLTTTASVVATILDHVAGNEKALTRWRPKNVSDTLAEKCNFYRRILDRLILNLADQQLVTGYALLICAWVKLSTNPVLKDWTEYPKRFPNIWLPNAQFSLVVFLCMASSTSHLACILVLRDYLEEHRSVARLRIVMIAVFAAFLAVSIALGSSLTTYFAWVLAGIFSPALDKRKQPPYWVLVLILALCIAVPLLLILAISYLCTLQLLPTLKTAIERKMRKVVLRRLRKWFRLSKIWHGGLMKVLPWKWRDPCTRFVKHCFWLSILGNEFMVFVIQVVLSILSMIWIGLQRLSTPPDFYSELDDGNRTYLCTLHHVAGRDEWASFGQLLPLILLILPVLFIYGSWVEERDDKRKSMQKQGSSYTSISEGDTSPLIGRNRSRETSDNPYYDASDFEMQNLQSGRHESDASVDTSYQGLHQSQISVGSLHAYSKVPTSPMPVLDSHSPRARSDSKGWSRFSTGNDGQEQVWR